MKSYKNYYVCDNCGHEFKILGDDKKCSKCRSYKITLMVFSDNTEYIPRKLYKL